MSHSQKAEIKENKVLINKNFTFYTELINCF